MGFDTPSGDGSADAPRAPRSLDVAPYGPDGGRGGGSVDGSWRRVEALTSESYTRHIPPGDRLVTASIIRHIADKSPPAVRRLLIGESRRCLIDGTVGDPLLTAGTMVLDRYGSAPRDHREAEGRLVVDFCTALAEIMPNPQKTRAVAQSTAVAMQIEQRRSANREAVPLPGD